MKISLPLVSLVFGLACAVLLVGHAEGRIGKETKITVEFSKNPFSFSVRPISNPFYNLVRTNGRKLTAETTTPAANTEDEDDGDEGPPTCTTTADCDHLYGYPGLPNGTSFECSNGMIYGYPNGNVCGVVCDTDSYCHNFGEAVSWPPGSTCHKKDPSSTSGVCKFAGTPNPDVGGENICKDPTRFNASLAIPEAGGMTCGSIQMICNNLGEVGGLLEAYMPSLVDQWVPTCCGAEPGTGRDHYNPESGCGSMPEGESESQEQMLCGDDPDNKFMPEKVYDGECKSASNDEAERCHEERCRMEKAFCESKRGQLIDPGKDDDHRRYPYDLIYEPRLCSSVLGACSYYRSGGTSCEYTKTDGSVDRCIDRGCSKDKATCLSREGTRTATDPSQFYRNMEWVESSGDDNLRNLFSELRHLKESSASCCSKGRDPSNEYFSPSCHSPARKEKVLNHLGCEPGKFNFGRETQYGEKRRRCIDEMYTCARIRMTKGTCQTPDYEQTCHDEECRASKEGCHAKRGKDGFGDNLEFKPFTFFEAAMELLDTHDSIGRCCDGEVQLEECKAHPDVPLLDLGMCKSGTFQPSREFPTGDCKARVWDHSHDIENECHDEQCRTDAAYCESRSGQLVGDEDEKIYGNLTFYRYTCGDVQERQKYQRMLRGMCGEWNGDTFDEKCHDTRCETKTGCEAEGYTFKAWAQWEIEDMNKRTARHLFISSDSVESYGICCDGAENLRTTEWPFTLEPLNIPEGYITGEEEKGCKKCDCCGDGTTCKDGLCYPTFDGAMQACKKERGEKWAWTCDGEAQCSANGDARRRLQNKPKPSKRWSKGWHTAKPARRQPASWPSLFHYRPSSRPSSFFHHRRR